MQITVTTVAGLIPVGTVQVVPVVSINVIVAIK
jgi:hypothetical protein